METLIYILSLFIDLDTTENTVPENIEYCATIFHNPLMEKEFNNSCNLEVTNKYIMSVKNGY